MASLLDLITDTRNAARPNSAKVASSRTAGAATLACDNLSGWPTASKVHFVTYQIDSSSNPVAGTQLDCVGIVSGNSLTSLTVKDGTDSGNAINDVVEMLPTAAWGQDLATALTTEHDRTGKHTNITATSLTNTGNSTIGGNQTIAGSLSVTGASTHTGASTFTGAIGGAGYSLATMFNPYKFRATGTSNPAWTSQTWTTIAFNAEQYDTGNNFNGTDTFTAPINGFYQFNLSVISTSASGNLQGIGLRLIKNNSVDLTQAPISFDNNVSYDFMNFAISDCVQLAANDTIKAQGWLSIIGGTVSVNSPVFSGFLVSAT